MITTKKIVAIIAFTTLLSLSLAGCAKEGKQAGGSPADGKPSITSAIYDRGNVPPNEGTVEKNRWTKWINENGPVNVTYTAIPRWESGEKYNTLFASKTAPDLIFEYDTALRNRLYTQKQLMPIDDMIEKYSTEYKKLLEQNPLLKKLALKSDGKMYEFGHINGLATNHVLYIREDWLKKLNLEVPKTTEDLYQVAKAFTEQDPDGNGKKDTYGYSLSFVTANITDKIFQNVGWVIEDGKLIHDWDRGKAATVFKKRLYDEGLVDKDFLADKNGEKARQDFINGKLGIFGMNNGADAPGLQLLEALRKNDPNAVIRAIPLPKSEFGQFSPEVQNPIQMTAAVNARAKNPEAVMKYVDFLVSKDTQKTLRYGTEGEHWKDAGGGCLAVIDKEKNDKELNYNIDYQMLTNKTEFGKCGTYASTLDPSKPLEKEFLGIIDQAKEAYLNPSRPLASIASGEHLPSPPQNIQLIQSNTGQPMGDIINKVVVSGSSYSVDQAMIDIKSVWDKTGGQEVDEWYESGMTKIKIKRF
ncbi:extracellular solute-binding protein [Paenibacillus dokdonensis]|uniref:Extracellular solute-binding protein n=1 Tax=Paenibacillus dokdonensis TaxID=2567944 RepID=A0ABU6GJT0_9BACL|nr:extracellular solute-binding protein [Paenibacillus dokdonensis]MEC0240002.1 extracellular solute-binding protein [Paenibacillus dokdonensis]